MAEVTSRDFVKDGVSRKQLCAIFNLSISKLNHLIADLPPCGFTQRQESLYQIADVAERVMAPKTEEDVLQHLIRTRPEDLPAKLKKEYWGALKARQDFELAAGDLWPTAKIVEYMSDTFKTLRMSLQLLADAVERQDTLTEKQRKIIQDAVDTTLNDMRERLQNAFKNKRNAEKRRERTGEVARPETERQPVRRVYTEDDYASL